MLRKNLERLNIGQCNVATVGSGVANYGAFGTCSLKFWGKINGTYDSADFSRNAMYNSALKLKIFIHSTAVVDNRETISINEITYTKVSNQIIHGTMWHGEFIEFVGLISE